jgi:hypothetical protein
LGIAQQFWVELENCRDALETLRKQIENSESIGTHPEMIQDQQIELEVSFNIFRIIIVHHIFRKSKTGYNLPNRLLNRSKRPVISYV